MLARAFETIILWAFEVERWIPTSAPGILMIPTKLNLITVLILQQRFTSYICLLHFVILKDNTFVDF